MAAADYEAKSPWSVPAHDEVQKEKRCKRYSPAFMKRIVGVSKVASDICTFDASP